MVDLPGAVTFLTAAQGTAGGWGYRPGGMAVIEPTAFALLALRGLPAGRESYRRGREWLAAQQRPDGAFGAFAGDTLPSWMTAPAALALRGSPEGERALDWLVQTHRSQPAFDGDPEPIRALLGIDLRQRGWPWAPGDSTFVEPTAQAVLALAAGARRDAPETHAGVAFLLDRAGPDGGWNIGNPLMVGKPMRSEAPFTGVTLLALRAAGLARSEPRVAAGLAFLQRILPELVAPLSLSWALLALPLWGDPRPSFAALDRLQEAGGGFAGEVLPTALAVLAERGGEVIWAADL